MTYELLKEVAAIGTVGVMVLVMWVAWQQRKVRDAMIRHIKVNSNI